MSRCDHACSGSIEVATVGMWLRGLTPHDLREATRRAPVPWPSRGRDHLLGLVAKAITWPSGSRL